MFILTACGQAGPRETGKQQAQTTITTAPISQTSTIAVAATVTVTTSNTNNPDWVNTASVDGDFYLRGNPDAPIRLIDYSDFL